MTITIDMPKTHYRQIELWEKKYTIFTLRLDGYSQERLSKLLNCSRETLRKFLNTPEYKAFAILFTEDVTTQEIRKIWKNVDLDLFDKGNRMTMNDIKNFLLEKHPELNS